MNDRQLAMCLILIGVVLIAYWAVPERIARTWWARAVFFAAIIWVIALGVYLQGGAMGL